MNTNYKSIKLFIFVYLVKYLFLLFQFVEENLSIMSVGFLLESKDDAVIWRGPKKNGYYIVNIPKYFIY